RLFLQFGQRLEQMPACFAEENQEAEHQQDRDYVPAAEQTDPSPDRNWHVDAHARCPAVTQRSKKPRPRPIEAACDRDHITPTLCHSNHFAARPTIPPPLSRLDVINSRSRDAFFVRTRAMRHAIAKNDAALSIFVG